MDIKTCGSACKGGNQMNEMVTIPKGEYLRLNQSFQACMYYFGGGRKKHLKPLTIGVFEVEADTSETGKN
jgi:hypothetical protein